MSHGRVAGVLMLAGFVAISAGGILWRTGRGVDYTGTARHAWERGLIITAIILTAVGLLLLAEYLRDTRGHSLALTGAFGYLLGGVLAVANEAGNISGLAGSYPQTVVYVVLAFLGQAAVGVSLIQSGSYPSAVGWATLVWNMAWLIILPVTTPGDISFPILHHVMPAVIAIPLVTRNEPGGPKSSSQEPDRQSAQVR